MTFCPLCKTLGISKLVVSKDGKAKKLYSRLENDNFQTPLLKEAMAKCYGLEKSGKYTGKSLSEALIFASTNPQHDDRLFIELQVQYMKIPSSNLGRTCCVQKLFLKFRTIFVHNMFSPCYAKRRASDEDLPVMILFE